MQFIALGLFYVRNSSHVRGARELQGINRFSMSTGKGLSTEATTPVVGINQPINGRLY